MSAVPDSNYDDSYKDEIPGLDKTKTGADLHKLENDPGSQAADGTSENSEPGARQLYNPKSKGSKPSAKGFKHFFWGSRPRKLATSGGGIGGGVGIGLMIALIIASGPAQLIQLSEVLQNPFINMNNTLGNRFNSELSHFTGAPEDISSTRLSTLGQFYLRPVVNRLNSAGIQYTENDYGKLNSVSIDPEKLAQSNSGFAEQNTVDEQKTWLAEHISGISPDDINVTQGDTILPNGTTLPSGSFSIVSDGPQFASDVAKGLIKGTTQLASDNVLGAIDARVLMKKYNVTTLFHPERAAENKAIKTAQNAQDAKTQASDDVAADTEAAIAGENATFGVSDLLATLKGNLSDFAESTAGKSLTGVLIGQDAYCEAYGSIGAVISFNRLGIVVPAALEAVRLIALGDQIKSGQDITSNEVGEAASSLTNSKGQSIWDAQALQVVENGQSPAGPDLPTDYAQAFSSNTTANEIQSTLGAHGFSSAACSTVGKLIAAAAGIVLLIAAIPTDGLTAVALFAVKVGVGVAATTAVMLAIKDIIETTLKDNAAVPEALSGPLGGNLAAYGARAAANITAVTDGGVVLNNSQTQQVSLETEQQNKKQFQSEPFFSRIFNIDNYQSLLGRIADDISPSISKDITNFASGILNIGSLIPKVIGGILPKATAANTYNWGFPEYGIPPSLLNSTDPTLSNPYENASMVVPLLQNDTDSVIERAETCFGVNINNSSGVWDVDPIANFDVNPNGNDTQGGNAGPSYASGNCNDGSTNWQRIMLFVVDTRAMQDGTCFMGNAQSCNEIGF